MSSSPKQPLLPELESLPARVVVVERVYHAAPGKAPTSVTNSFSRKIEKRDSPYVREMELSGTGDWKELDSGWVENIGLLIVSAPASGAPIEIGVLYRAGEIVQFSGIPVGESIRITPTGPTLFLRKAVGHSEKRALATVMAFPK